MNEDLRKLSINWDDNNNQKNDHQRSTSALDSYSNEKRVNRRRTLRSAHPRLTNMVPALSEKKKRSKSSQGKRERTKSSLTRPEKQVELNLEKWKHYAKQCATDMDFEADAKDKWRKYAQEVIEEEEAAEQSLTEGTKTLNEKYILEEAVTDHHTSTTDTETHCKEGENKVEIEIDDINDEVETNVKETCVKETIEEEQIVSGNNELASDLSNQVPPLYTFEVEIITENLVKDIAGKTETFSEEEIDETSKNELDGRDTRDIEDADNVEKIIDDILEDKVEAPRNKHKKEPQTGNPKFNFGKQKALARPKDNEKVAGRVVKEETLESLEESILRETETNNILKKNDERRQSITVDNLIEELKFST